MNKKQTSLKLSAVALAVLLASCGGGDGYFNKQGEGSGSGSGSGQSDNGIEQPKLTTLNITNIVLYDQANNPTNILTSLGLLASVKVTDQNGQPISGVLVNFSGEEVIFGTSNGSVISNSDGIASISIKPSNEANTGSYKISATAEINTATAQTAPTYFTVAPIQTKFEAFKASSNVIDAGGTTNISLVTKDPSTNTIQNNIKVDLKATCGTFDSDSILSANQGNVLATYKAIDVGGKLCTGPVTVFASTNNNATSASLNLTVNPAKANSLVYTSGVVKLGAINSGSTGSGQVEFTVYSDKVPAADQDVVVELVNSPSDLSFVNLNNRNLVTLKTNSLGKLLVNIYPGSIPGPVEIKATLASDSSIYALSKDVSVATGRVTQNGLSLSVTKNALQWDVDGDQAQIVARLRDRVGNKVPDGTIVSFVTEGGSITPNCSTVNGECMVTLQTQNPRPLDNRVTVLAFVEGDKSYIDKNSDNRYTAGIDELTSNIGDFFRDDNENTIFEAALGEFLYKRGAIGVTCASSSFIQPNISGTCDTGLEAVIRQQLVFAFSNDVPTITDEKIVGKSNLTFKLFGNSAQSVPMPSGTTVELQTEDNTDANNKSCTAQLWSGSTPVASVFNLLTPSSFNTSSQVFYNYRLKECDSGDSLILNVKAPSGQITKKEYIIQ